RGFGFKFVGPTTMYAAMQSLGLVNDHFEACQFRQDCQNDREIVLSAMRA
ncbi:MAG: DNA-3-methyladenine glycosylase I, partial [Actinomycetota bacterium]